MKRLHILSLFICFHLWITVAFADTIVLPSGLQIIEEDAFTGAASITEVVIPEGAAEIGSHAFGDCENLSTINIPETVTSLSEDIFDGSPHVVATVTKGSIAEKIFKDNNIDHQTVDDPGSVNVPGDSASWNGHTYKVYDEYKNWNDAKSFCESLGGHLVTITSSAEQNFVSSILETHSRNFYFMGGTDAGSEGSWRWITGESWNYSAWSNGSPDNYYGNENCLQIANVAYNGIRFSWNDHNNNGYYSDDGNGNMKYPSQIGFICEWDSCFLQWADGTTATKRLDVEAAEQVELFTIYTNAICAASTPDWISLRPNAIDPNGKAGSYTIEATIQANPNAEERTGRIVISADGCKSLVLQVNQAANVPEQVTLTSATWNLGWVKDILGQYVTVHANVKGNANKKVTYTSSNPAVATVTSYGKVKAVGVGETTITATTVNGVQDSHVMHVYAFPFKWEDIKEAIKKSNTTIAQLMDLYYDKLETDADIEIESIMDSFDSLFSGGYSMTGKLIDPEAEKMFKEQILGVARTFKSADRITSYSDVKTSVDLAKKVLKAMVHDGEGSFSFTCKNITYTCTFHTSGIFNNDFSQITMQASNGQTFMWSLVTTSPKSIEAEMAYLKQFADMKIQEVRDKAYTDAVKVLGISEYIEEVKKFFTNVKNTAKGKAWSVIQDQFPDLAQLVNEVTDSARALESKYNAVKNAFNGLKEPDWTGDLGTKVVSDITGYHEKVNTFIEAMEALVP